MRADKKIGIPKPCPKQWDEMTPADSGRFCGSCNKVVMDFTAMSDEELITTLRNLPKGTCGMFANEQLAEQPLRKQNTLIKIAATVALVIGAQAAFGTNDITESDRRDVEISTNHLQNYVIIKGFVEVKGDLPDSIRISIKGVSGRIYATIADSRGYFELTVPLIEEPKFLLVEADDYGKKEVEIVNSRKGEMNIILESDWDKFKRKRRWRKRGRTMGKYRFIGTPSF